MSRESTMSTSAGNTTFATATLLIVFVFTIAAFQTTRSAEAVNTPMGSLEDITYATRLWSVMQSEKLVGTKAEKLKPFFGGARPHGIILELAYRNLTVGNHTGFLVVKKNYNGTDVSVANVEKNRAKYLSSITVMYRREKGYDEDNQNWFWVKYRPDGSLFKKDMKGKSVALAGRILKGKTRDENGGCIYCHSSARDGDYVFYPDIKVPPVND
jgi:hypothetical protein